MSLKGEILEKLKSVFPSHVSGQSIAESFGVSRSAVWKAVNRLKREGYPIEGSPRRGYRLTAPSDLLTRENLLLLLKTRTFGRSGYFHHREVTSTNDVAKLLAREGCPHGTVIVAEAQSRGRGRLGRSWLSPPGAGVYFSLVLRPDFEPPLAPRITLLAGVAVARAIQSLSSLEPKIKWPNDVLLGERKVAGILMEMEAEADLIHYLVLGVGVNANMDRAQLPESLNATSLFLETRTTHSRCELLARVLYELESLWDELLSRGFEPVAEMWRKMSFTLGKIVKVEKKEEILCGQAEDIDEHGCLLVRDQEGRIHRVSHGEVMHVR
jgi:BirA family biotin operon repressor/biotin-[acetyl-CoA-carboxylase] ligase